MTKRKKSKFLTWRAKTPIYGVLLLILCFSFTALWENAEFQTLNFRFFARSEINPIQSESPIVLVYIDDATLSEINWPFPNQIYANFIQKMDEFGAKVIAFDKLFFDFSCPPDNTQELELAQAAQKFKNIIWAGKIIDENKNGSRLISFEGPIKEISNVGRIGFINLPQDSDKQIRRATLQRVINETPTFNFALQTYLSYKNLDSSEVKKMGDRLLAKGLNIPLDSKGAMYINYSNQDFSPISFWQVLDTEGSEFIKDKFKEAIVLVGASASELKDNFSTVLSFVAEGQRQTPGVAIHAHTINTLLMGKFLYPVQGILSPLLILLLGIGMIELSNRLTVGKSIFIGVVLALGYLVFSVIIFSFGGWIVPVAGPELAIIITLVFVIIARYHLVRTEKQRIRGIFSRYVSKGLVDNIIDKGGEINLGGEKLFLTVLFSDIRGFTTISEKMPPEELVSLLNEYFTAMTDVIFTYGGMLDKYVGDAIMAIIGAPYPHADPNHPLTACRIALGMKKALEQCNVKWEKEGKPKLNFGVGINTGEMILGHVGSPVAMGFTVLGDAVNLGSRLQDLNKTYGTNIIISKDTKEACGDAIETRSLGEKTVKGKEIPVEIFELLGLKKG